MITELFRDGSNITVLLIYNGIIAPTFLLNYDAPLMEAGDN